MNHNSAHYRKLFEKMPDAFAYHQVVFDSEGTPVDYVFLEVNRAFEELTGLKREKVIGRKVTEVHPEISGLFFDWINVYAQVASEGESTRFEQYFEPADRWYNISAFSDKSGHFAVTFREVTLQKNENLVLTKLAGLALDILQNPSADLNYQAISDNLLELSGAKFAAINIYEQEGKKTVTKAISGVAENIRKVCKLLRFELTGKAWDVIPERLSAIKKGHLLRFANLYDSASGTIPLVLAKILEKTFGTGEACVIEIGYENDTIGDLIMFLPRHQTLINPEIIELYAAQVGFALMRNRAEESLRESRDQYQSLVNNIPGTSYRCLYDENWTMLYMSSDVDNITGYPSSDFIHNRVRSYASVICQDDNDNNDIIKAAIEADKTWDIEYRVIHSDGSIRWVHEKGRGVFDNAGTVTYIDGLILDITERKQIEEALRESEKRHRALVGAIPDLLFRYNSKGVYLDAVVKDEKMLYDKAKNLYRQKELVGKTIWEVLPEPVASALMSGIENALVRGEIDIQEYSYPVNNLERFFETRLAPIDDTEVVSIVRDITDRKNYMAELEYISLHDQLTDLYNRHYFENELWRLAHSRDYPIAIISADLDGLKLINDTIGHAEGDNYLQKGAELMKSVLRPSDILARVGGDEFAMILPHISQHTGEKLVTRLRNRIEQYNQERQGLPVSISIGLAVSENSKQSLEETFKKADHAMYNDKLKRGKLARAGIVASLLDRLKEQGNLGEGSSVQVQKLCNELGRILELSEKQMTDLQLLARAYDLGKINMPEQFIRRSLEKKAAQLTEAEKEAIRSHPEIGYRIALASPELAGVADLILRHHENYDGSGYPLGLKGDDVPLECRILAIVTAYSAMTNAQPYTKNLTHDQTLKELKRQAGTRFDPRLVETFMKIVGQQ